MSIKNIFYVAELNFPNSSAYSIHSIKMCEALAETKYNVELYILNNSKSEKNIHKNYNVKFYFKIKSVFKRKKILNFFSRIFYSFLILKKTSNINCIFISRSIVFAIIGSIFKKKIILELHHEITGLTNIFYKISYKLNFLKNLKYIFLHKNLKDKFNIKNKYLILDDCVNLNDFKNIRQKKIKNTVIYLGSFHQGKGIDTIIKVAKISKKINFHIYGHKKFLKKKISLKNVKLFGFINYKKVPEILSKYYIAIMPYEKIVKGRGSVEIQKYMSPLKMFDYMAAKKIIVASDLNIYNHILKHNYNALLIKKNNILSYKKNIEKVIKNPNKFNYLSRNAYKTVKNFTWNKRIKKIEKNLFCK